MLKEALAFQKDDVQIKTLQGEKIVPALVAGSWALHKAVAGSAWVITFIPSGKVVLYPKTKAKGLAMVEEMLEEVPSLLHARSESDVMAHKDYLFTLSSGILPFSSILAKERLHNLGEPSGKSGDQWGLPGGSIRIRVGARDIVVTKYRINGLKLVNGRDAIDAVWETIAMVDQSKVDRAKLESWIHMVKNAPTTQQLRDEYREGR